MFSKKFIFYIAFCIVASSWSQQMIRETLSSGGSSHFVYGENTSFFIQESIGQGSVINTFTSVSNYSARQGFIQPISVAALYNGLDDMIDASIWPNPFTNTINIILNEPLLGGGLAIAAYDLTGRLVYDNTFSSSPDYTISLANLSNGIYLLKLETQARSFTTKVIKR